MELSSWHKAMQANANSSRQPVVFIGHGSPMNALADNPFTQSLHRFGASFAEKPAAILMVSAHWLTRGSFVYTGAHPPTIHDFGGFPDELFAVEYPAPGAPEIAKSVSLLAPEIKTDESWGLDHGAWTILKHIFPKADVPVFQMSIDFYQPMSYHFELAAKLKSLRDKGVLIMGSGNIVHNIGMSIDHFMKNNPAPYDWAIEFDAWVKGKLQSGDYKSLINYENAGSSARLAVPSTDHYIPMLYTLGLTDADELMTQLYEEVSYGGMSMRCFKVG
jgi:4,5-DOPA dioxygenase extradiol